MILSNHWLSLKEAAAHLRISVQTMGKLVRTGKLKARKVGGQWRLRQTDVDGRRTD